jgi:hypothetical protein
VIWPPPGRGRDAQPAAPFPNGNNVDERIEDAHKLAVGWVDHEKRIKHINLCRIAATFLTPGLGRPESKPKDF